MTDKPKTLFRLHFLFQDVRQADPQTADLWAEAPKEATEMLRAMHKPRNIIIKKTKKVHGDGE